ncbi:MAG: hypothetical protein WCB63_10150 [Polyangiales bacterium]
MRYVFRFLCVCALGVVQLPQSASAQAGEKGTTSEPNLQEPAASAEPAREEGASRLERWHPEAFDDPSEPTSMPVYVDPVTGAPLTVPEDTAASEMPTAPPTEERKRRRRIGIGVGVSIGVVVVLAVLGGVAAKGLRDL